MRLTQVVLRYYRNNPNGNIWTGKHRLAHHIFPHQKENFIRRLKIEEKNLKLLCNPYLTKDQDELYNDQVLKVEEKEKWLVYRDINMYRVRPSIRTEDRLGHLNVMNSWEKGY